MTPTIYHVNTHLKTKRCDHGPGLLSVPVHTLQQEGSTVGAVDIVRQLAEPAKKKQQKFTDFTQKLGKKKHLPGLPRVRIESQHEWSLR